MSTVRDHFCSTRAKDVMTCDVVSVSASQEMGIAAQELRDHCITGVPVVSREGRCVGVLSTKDFLKQSRGDSGVGSVSAHMTSPANTVSENHSLLDVAVSRIRFLPWDYIRERISAFWNSMICCCR